MQKGLTGNSLDIVLLTVAAFKIGHSIFTPSKTEIRSPENYASSTPTNNNNSVRHFFLLAMIFVHDLLYIRPIGKQHVNN